MLRPPPTPRELLVVVLGLGGEVRDAELTGGEGTAGGTLDVMWSRRCFDGDEARTIALVGGWNPSLVGGRYRSILAIIGFDYLYDLS